MLLLFFAFLCIIGKGWPLNYHLTFDLLAVISVGAIVLCLFLPASSEKKRECQTASTLGIVLEQNSSSILEQDSSSVVEKSRS